MGSRTNFTLLRIEGTGDVYTFFGRAKYPDGVTWHVMSIIEVRSAKIAKTTWVFGAPFDSPASRAQWVERLTYALRNDLSIAGMRCGR